MKNIEVEDTPEKKTKTSSTSYTTSSDVHVWLDLTEYDELGLQEIFHLMGRDKAKAAFFKCIEI